MVHTREAAARLRADAVRRDDLRARLSRSLDLPMSLVSVLMLLVAFVELSGKLSSKWQGQLAIAAWGLWAIFVLEFLAKLILAPHKGAYLRRHWLDVLIVVFPFFGFLRILTLARALPLMQFLVYGGRNLGPHLAILKRRGLGKLAVISVLVLFIAAILEAIFEIGARGSTITDVGAALWWAASTATTVGSQLYPVTPGGEVVAFLLMLYAIGVFSYLTSSVASALIGGDAQQDAGQPTPGGTTNQGPAAGQSSAANQGPPASQGSMAVQGSATGPGAASSEGTGQDGGIHLTSEELEVLRSILRQAEKT